MMIAVTHIGGIWRPGDILPEDLPEETRAWLRAAGAVREEGAPEPEAPEPEAPVEYDDEAEAEEIDVMDGIVNEAPKPARKKGGSRR